MSQLSHSRGGSLTNEWELVPRLASQCHVGSVQHSQAEESCTLLSRCLGVSLQQHHCVAHGAQMPL